MNKNIVLFPGCMISYRLPFIEVSVKKALDFLAIPYSENSRFSCCPEPNGIKNTHELMYSVTAARNLSLAEINSKDILTPCNGCFETLKGVRSEIKSDLHLQKKVNEYLKKINLHVTGKGDVFHLVEFFHKLGRDAIKDKVVYTLNSLKVAVHYGCHFLRPSNKIQMDDPFKPSIFDELIEDLGAKSIDYVRKMDCCGGSLSRADSPESSLEMVHSKLESIKEADADCIVVGCPQCFLQFDTLQQELKKLDYDYDIPVLYYSELLCIALGIDIKDMINKFHRTPVDKILKKVDIIHRKNEQIKKFFDVDFLKKCYACSACNNDCPVAKLSKATLFNPQKFIGQLLNGEIEEVIADPAIWLCLDCYVCYELCPMKIGLVEIFTTLRNLAREKGYIPKGFQGEFESFVKMGTVSMFSKSARKRAGLEATVPELEDLISILDELMEEK